MLRSIKPHRAPALTQLYNDLAWITFTCGVPFLVALCLFLAVAIYLDERADERQREALGAVLSGAQGGPPEMLSGLIGEQLGVKFVPITFTSNGDLKRVEVPGIMEFEVEGLHAPGSSAVMEIVNVFHPMGANLPIARSITGRYSDPDYGLSFDNTGKNGHFREFAWQA